MFDFCIAYFFLLCSTLLHAKMYKKCLQTIKSKAYSSEIHVRGHHCHYWFPVSKVIVGHLLNHTTCFVNWCTLICAHICKNIPPYYCSHKIYTVLWCNALQDITMWWFCYCLSLEDCECQGTCCTHIALTSDACKHACLAQINNVTSCKAAYMPEDQALLPWPT